MSPEQRKQILGEFFRDDAEKVIAIRNKLNTKFGEVFIKGATVLTLLKIYDDALVRLLVRVEALEDYLEED